MIKLVVGTKGNGKTKFMLDNANESGKASDGVVVYIDKNSEHMFQLDKSVRLINLKEYPIGGLDAIIGFLCGLISGNHDIEQIYLDSFLALTDITDEGASEAVKKLLSISDVFGVDFTVSLSMEEDKLSEEFKQYVVHSL